MKTIGLIGGMSWESTALYYRILNEEVKLALGGLHSARVVLYSLDFDEIEVAKSGTMGRSRPDAGASCAGAFACGR